MCLWWISCQNRLGLVRSETIAINPSPQDAFQDAWYKAEIVWKFILWRVQFLLEITHYWIITSAWSHRTPRNRHSPINTLVFQSYFGSSFPQIMTLDRLVNVGKWCQDWQISFLSFLPVKAPSPVQGLDALIVASSHRKSVQSSDWFRMIRIDCTVTAPCTDSANRSLQRPKLTYSWHTLSLEGQMTRNQQKNDNATTSAQCWMGLQKRIIQT